MLLDTAVKGAAIPAEVAHGVVDAGHPLRKEGGLFGSGHGVNLAVFRQHHKGDGGGVLPLLGVELGLIDGLEAILGVFNAHSKAPPMLEI